MQNQALSDYEFIKSNLQRIRSQIGGAKLVAATKTISPERLKIAEALGVKVFGENRVQELLDKFSYFPHVEWHFIGHLQTNKVKYIVDKVSLIHSVDSIRLMEEIDRQAGKIGKIQDILIEINAGAEENKTGMLIEEAERAAQQATQYPHLKLRGLMGMVPPLKNIGDNDKYYLQMQRKYDIIKNKYGCDLLSMGMSGDYLQALKFGSNIVRIGSGIFGERNYSER